MNLFDYTDYRLYLRDWLLEAREKRGLSRRNFSRRAGLKSSGHLKMILDGKRNVGAKTLERFMSGLRLTGEERLFFQNLVLRNQAATDAEKSRYEGKLNFLRKCRALHPHVRQRIEDLRHEMLKLLAPDHIPEETADIAEPLLSSE